MSSGSNFKNAFAALDLHDADSFHDEGHEPASQPGYRGGSVGSRRGRAKRLAGRKWVSTTATNIDSPSGDWLTLRMVSYNVLAKCYAQQKHFTACKPEHLRWTDRRAALIEVIDELDADILCLQEVQDYDKFWQAELYKKGYLGVYKKRNSDRKHDGCATFYRSAKLEKVDTKTLEFDELSKDCITDVSENLPDFATHNVALVTVLRQRGRVGGRCFCVANAHLFWDPCYEELKISQARALVRATSEVSEKHGNAPIILAGDFNSVPDSSVYRFLTSQAAFTSAYAFVSTVRRPIQAFVEETPKQTSEVAVEGRGGQGRAGGTDKPQTAVEAKEKEKEGVVGGQQAGPYAGQGSAQHRGDSMPQAVATTNQARGSGPQIVANSSKRLMADAAEFVSPSASPSKSLFTKALNPNSPVFSPGGGAHGESSSSSSRILLSPGGAEGMSSKALQGAQEKGRRTDTGEPAFTNYRDIFHGAIDYVFYKGGGVEARSCLGMIGEAEARREGGGLPNSHHPSDHLPIAVELVLKQLR